jgi:hypothetical protein
VKIPLGLWEGSTENAAVATALLSGLVERSLDPEQGILFVIDGAKALRKAIRTVFGDAPVQRCVRHKERTCSTSCPSVSGRRSSSGCGERGRTRTMPARSTSCERSPPSLIGRIPAPPARSGRGWRRH